MRAITVTAGLVLAAGSLAFTAPVALADAARTTATDKPSATVAPSTAEQAAVRKQLASTTDAVERKRLEDELARQVKAVPRGGADTGLADTTGEASSWELIPLGAGGVVLAGVAGAVLLRRRRLQLV